MHKVHDKICPFLNDDLIFQSFGIKFGASILLVKKSYLGEN
jgi:hypothetical protein